MKRVLFLTNYPSPYRVRFFDELGKTMDVTVLFAKPTSEVRHRNKDWYISGQGNFRAVQLERGVKLGGSTVYTDVISWLRRDFDHIVVCGYGLPTMILAMAYMRLRRIRFDMEVDGGLIRQENWLKYRFKRRLVRMASRWLSTGRATTEYLVHYGANPERVVTYPFSSLSQADLRESPASQAEKEALRRELDLPEGPLALSIGQFIHRKGFDVLMKASAGMDVSVCIVGGEPGEEYRKLRRELGADRVIFRGFQKKEALANYYRAADLFVLPTREDIWGLVINEAMAFGLPVVTTDKCVAGLELVEECVNGALIPADDPQALAEAIRRVLEADLWEMGKASLEKIRPYTIENMAHVHEEIFESGR